MSDLFDKASNSATATNTGSSPMTSGDYIHLSSGSYECNIEGSNCATSISMLSILSLSGSIICVSDAADCVLDGKGQKRGLYVKGSGGPTLILRAITFKDGWASSNGGGISAREGAILDIILCKFISNEIAGTSASTNGGGGINVNDAIVNIYATVFSGNTAGSDGYGGDIRIIANSGTITIHNTCPSPYSSTTPMQGKQSYGCYF